MKSFHNSKIMYTVLISVLVWISALLGSASKTLAVAPVLTFKPNHIHIVTTVFWVGEPGDSDNGFIPNKASAWDEQWQLHYGGVDALRPPYNPASIYWPAKFTPKENPFYFALPYNDYTDVGVRKVSAQNCPNKPAHATLLHHSWCKNTWVAIRFNGKVVYAQWEDSGPFRENDVPYVFGTALPTNKVDVKAGLDVSPAVHDYLKLGDVTKTDWTFVNAANVPAGPWKRIVTTSLGVYN